MGVENNIPGQYKGISTNTESTVECSSARDAMDFFNVVRARLLNVNGWHELSGSGTADFQLIDERGEEVSRHAQTGDRFKINLPAPGSDEGDGYDWVKIESIEEDESCIAIHVRPCSNPLNDSDDIAHFFDEDATSSFVVKRDNASITAGVYGRNELPNTSAGSLSDKLRNAVVAIAAFGGMAKYQWKSLVNGLVRKNS